MAKTATPTEPTVAATEDAEMTRDQALRESYVSATKALREEYKDRFNALRKEHAAALGYDWDAPLTAEQKAEQDLARLIEQYPHLADKIKTDGIGAVL